VTAKGRTGSTRSRTSLPWLHTVLVIATGLSAAWFVATSAGLTPMTYAVPWAANGAALWLVVNCVLLVRAVRRIKQDRYSAERRSAVRFPVAGRAVVEGVPARLLDASLTGFRAVVMTSSGPQVGDRCRVGVHGEDGAVDVGVVVRSRRVVRGAIGDEHVLGLEVLPGQLLAQAQLSRVLFQAAQVEPAAQHLPVPVLVPQQRPAAGRVAAGAALVDGSA
jgi:cellulose synthase (UDP-forming)